MTPLSRFTLHLINAACILIAVTLVVAEHLTRLTRWAYDKAVRS